MEGAHWIAALAAGLILARLVAELWLSELNRRHVRAHANAVPAALKSVIDLATYQRTVKYTLAKNRFSRVVDVWNAFVLLLVLLSGVLPWVFGALARVVGVSAWGSATILFLVALALSALGLPFEWFADFKLEQRFGFNTTTPRTWWLDRVKGLGLALALGYPLLVLVLKCVEWAGTRWWLWAWGCLLAFQLAMLVLAPVLILPLFNRFTPLPEGPLRERLLALARRTGFMARGIEVMDGSKRSRHSNAFFTGLGRFRKIVLFDTLVQQLTASELAAVLAHEVGHFKRRHILKRILLAAAVSLGGFYALSLAARAAWFYRGFGFAPGNLAAALLLFGLLSGVVSFWLSPVANWWSRRHEYEADTFAAEATADPQALIGALQKLSRENLSNLTPHPWYSGFYYSHPVLLERVAALQRIDSGRCTSPGG